MLQLKSQHRSSAYQQSSETLLIKVDFHCASLIVGFHRFKFITMLLNISLGADTQPQDAASRRMLRAGQL